MDLTSKEALEKFKLLYESKCKEQPNNLIGFDMCYVAVKKDLKRLEVLESNSDKVIKDSVKLINRNLELQQENEKLKEIFNTLIAWLQQEKEKVKLDIKKSTRHGQLANAFGKENIIEAVLEYLTEKGLGNDR